MKIEKFRLLAGDITGLAIPSVDTLPDSAPTNLLVVHQGALKRARSAGQPWQELPALNPSLFAFASHTFVRGTAQGRLGPINSNLPSAYTSQPFWGTNYFSLVNGIQHFTVPKTGIYNIRAKGAKGGGPTAGRGATTEARFLLQMGDVLRILVGQPGVHAIQGNIEYASGGGGTFVESVARGLLLAAGGGGGSFVTYGTNMHGGLNVHGLHGSTILTNHNTQGGYNGAPGLSVSVANTVAGGGGSYQGAQSGYYGGLPFNQGGYGGNGTCIGGFGAGGGCYTTMANSRICGGGGGYSGGGAGCNVGIASSSVTATCGGGGGSYISRIANTTQAIINTNVSIDGFVVISFIE